MAGTAGPATRLPTYRPGSSGSRKTPPRRSDMSAQREPPTAADVIVTALSPVLSMGLVGSLVFFLAEVFYAGRYESRLLYTLFFFVVGAVLTGRIAVAVDRARAWAYGGVLAIVTFLALRVWVEYPEGSAFGALKNLINVVLFGCVLWATMELH